MNDHSNSLPPAGDDALQARIVAWVLGEASPFEAAELEKLCAENPRLRDFERRTRDLHELLVADAKPNQGLHPTWQLPPEKRGKITDLLGADTPVLQPAYSSEKVNRYFSRRILLAAAACLALSVITFPVFMNRLENKSRVYGARVPEKTVDFMPSSAGGGSGSGRGSERATLDTRRTVSRESLGRVSAEGASTSYAIPDPEPMTDLARGDGSSALSSGLGGRGSGGGRGDGPQGPVSRPAKPAAATGPVTATAASPEQERLRKQLADLEESEDALADNAEFAKDRLSAVQSPPLTSSPAAPPPPMAAPAAPALVPQSEAELPQLAGGGVAGAGGAVQSQLGMNNFRADTAYPYRYQSKEGDAAGARFRAPSDGPVEAKGAGVAPAKDAPVELASRSQPSNNHDFIPTTLDTAKLAEEVRYKTDEEANIPALPAGTPMLGGFFSNGVAPAPAEPGLEPASKEMADSKPLDAAAMPESLAKKPAAADKDSYYLETERSKAGAKGDLAWSGQDEGTKSGARGLSSGLADGMDRDRDIDRAKEVVEETAVTKKSKADAVGLGFSDEFGDVAGEKGQKQREEALRLAGEPSPSDPMRTDLATASGKAETSFQRGITLDGSGASAGTNVTDIVTGGLRNGDPTVNRNNLDAILNNPNSAAGASALTGTWGEDPQVRPQGGMPTGLDAASKRHYSLMDGKTIQMNGSVTLSDGGIVSENSLTELQSAGQPLPATGERFGMNLRLGAERDDFGSAPSLSLDSLATLDAGAKRADTTLNYYAEPGFYSQVGSAAPANGRFAWSVPPPAAGKPMSGGTTTWFDTASPLGVPQSETMFGREVQPQITPPATPELPAQQMAQGGERAEGELAVDAKRVNEWLDDPIRTNPSVPATQEHADAIDKVRRSLYLAEGAYNLGKFDDSGRHYEDVIRTDPYNKAARRGLERVAQARADYYRAAYDHTRAELLAQVDSAWELAVPPVGGGKPAQAAPDVAAKASAIRIPEVKAEGASVGEMLDLLRMRSRELDTLTSDPALKGINMVLKKPGVEGEGIDPEKIIVPKLELKDASISEVLGEISEATGLDVEMDEHAITLKTGPRTKGRQTEQIVDKMAEVATAAEPFSTFSLHVSDASFKLAKAALDRGEQPAAESIRPEEFYNAFDYGDPAPANGEPVVCETEQCAHPAIPQRNLMRIAVRTAAAGRGGSTPLNLTLLLDSSGSMEREDRQAAMSRAVAQLAGLLKEGDTITVAGFARQPRLLADRLRGTRAQELNGIIAQTPSEGGTNLEEGIKLAEELAKRQFNPAAQNRIVLFTDGAANLGDARPEALKQRVEQLRQQGIAFDAAGFGADGLNDRLLEQLTRNGNGRYYIVDRPEDAGTGFAKQLAGAFRPAAENVKVQVRFNPARVARYKLIGFEEHRLNKEDFRNDAVDAAEMAAEEAGVALYQIEPLPGGEGELGEVSVRFRDVASGQMVERTWTMPYEPQASAFDQAPPSIQLAGMAAFAAEKLRKAPLSDALDFKQLGKVFPAVKAKYPDSQPVSDLGGMIEKLK